MIGLLQHIEQNIQHRQLLKPRQPLLVAVSGGLDSMVLLHALVRITTRHKSKITVAHFNHRLRARAADADERFVRKTSAAMKLPAVVGRADVIQFAQKSKISIELAARKLRHEFLARVARERKISTVALAHHADDQVELFLLRILRGTGGRGLVGMKWSAPSPADQKITLVRPLLDLGKDELRNFARENKISFRDDATNFLLDSKRNRIRNELLPLLRKNYQPGFNKIILRLMKITGAEAEAVAGLARQWLKRRRPIFENLPVAVQRRVLQMQLAESGVSADFELVEKLRKSANCLVSANSSLFVSRDTAGTIKLRAQRVSQFNYDEVPLNLTDSAGSAVFGGAFVKWNFDTSKNILRRRGKAGREFFDADKVGSKIILRHWRAGDRFQPIGLPWTVKLQDLFVNGKISAAVRRGLILATTASGEIFWVEGLRIGEPFKLTAETSRQLIWNWSNLANELSLQQASE
jgi:tRNA(Ile)-lysidine synthase